MALCFLDTKNKQSHEKLGSEHYKAGMKASSFLKIGVNENTQTVVLKNTYVYYIYNNKKKHTGGFKFVFSLIYRMETSV